LDSRGLQPIPPVNEALAEPRQQVHPRVRLPEQQTAASGVDRATAELSHHLARASAAHPKLESIFATLRYDQDRFLSRRNIF